jgi:UPF0755 protein
MAAVGTVTVFHAVYSRPEVGGAGATPVLFTVVSGESFSSLAGRLEGLGLMGRPRAVSVWAWLRGWDRRVKAGTYRFVRGDRARDIVEKLVRGDVLKVSVTIPEGFRYSQIAGVLAGALAPEARVDSVAFSSLSTDREVLDALDVEGPSLEGYLFPDTYLIPWGMTAEEIVRMMRARLSEVFDADMRRRVEELGMTVHQALTLASIIQAETRLPEEFALVSAVYHNRLNRGMRLEADPTVAYAMGGYRSRLYYKDLETESPYNTYQHDGLPPGPICAPGRAAIIAALYPDTACKAVYFVAKGDGGHIFSLTLDDHLRAVEIVKKAGSN